MNYLVELGLSDFRFLSIEAFSIMRETKGFLLSEDTKAQAFLQEWGLFFDVLPKNAQDVLATLQKEAGPWCLAVPCGKEEEARFMAQDLLKEGIPFTLIPAPSVQHMAQRLSDAAVSRNYTEVRAEDLRFLEGSTHADLWITQLQSEARIQEVLERLGTQLPASTLLTGFFPQQEEPFVSKPLEQWCLDGAKSDLLQPGACLWLKKEDLLPGFMDFYETVATLRRPGGCPWDREQTHESLRRYLIEEAYEASDALALGQQDEMVEELGDVLLQVFLHSRIAQEAGAFSIWDVLRTVNSKMIQRHPHVFSSAPAKNTQEVLDRWEEIKRVEKGSKSAQETLEAIPRSMPSLMRAVELQKKAKHFGMPKESPDVHRARILTLVQESKVSRRDLGGLAFELALYLDALGEQPELLLSEAIEQKIRDLAQGSKIPTGANAE
ncbi:putative nucleoside triphosphate pyrophosphohydrolase MazG [Clostridiaceae bacterium JG1575]|nr:putative nucleoside triphosphate pyrophosphohydrolase MazG [Clostridiaceae bacterium JG1575]